MDYIADFIKGNEIGFSVFYKNTWKQLFWFTLKHCADAENAKDIAQISYLKVWENRKKINPEFLSFRSYLFTIAINEVKKEYLKLIKKKEAEFQFHYELEEETSEVNDREQKMLNLIATFPNKQKIVFQLVKLEELSYQEVARKLGISKSTVEKHIIKSMKILKQSFT